MKKQLFKFTLIGLLLALALPFSAFAQQKQVNGTVTDSKSGEPVIGATVSLKGKTSGTLTDADGKFELSAENSDVLIFAFMGYKTIEVEVGSQTSFDVKMDENQVDLEQVVVIGYGQVRQKDATGSVSTVSSSDFNKGAIVSPQELIMGKSSGVQITPESGAPGGGVTIRIRGGASLTASNDPLIVIDGVPMDNDGVSGMSNPLSVINPNDIESFSVLKDASATAIYGSRASNGVILITTKKGSKKKLAISYNGNISLGVKAKQIDVFSADEYRALIIELFGADSNAAKLLGTESTDWQKEIFQTAIGTDHNISVGGTQYGIPFRVSGGYSYQKGILKTSEMKRFTGSLNLNPTFFDKTLRVDFNLKGMNVDNRFASTGAIGSALTFDPTKPVYDGNTQFGGYYTWMAGGIPNSNANKNPVALLEQVKDKATVKKAIGSLKLDYSLPFFRDLTATVNMGFDYSKTDGTKYSPETASFTVNTEGTVRHYGEDRSYWQKKQNQLFDAYLTYTKEIPAIASKITAMGGYSWQYFRREDFTRAFSADGVYDMIKSDITHPTQSCIMSYFGRLDYALLDRYLLTATVRADGTSRFAEGNKWGTFPSFAFAWKINQESFLKDVKAITNLKLRLGYGKTGQQYITNDDFPYLARYNMSYATARYLFGDEWVTMARPEGYNDALRWEETTTQNIGLDFGLVKDRITGSLDLYKRETTDLINLLPTAAGTNFADQIITNVGTLENTGLEFILNFKPIVKKDMYWDVSFNMSFNKNEITKLTVNEDEDYQGVAFATASAGKGNNVKINSVGQPSNSFFLYQQVYDQDGKPISGLYVDRNNDGKIDIKDKYHCGSSNPKSLFGISTQFEYKDFFASTACRMSFGNYMYNDYEASNANYQYTFNSNYLTNLPKSVLDTELAEQRWETDYYVQDASFFKLDYLTFGYKFKNLLNKYNLTASFTIQNVFVITPYKGIDPEVFNGIDNNIYPRPRNFIFGLSLDL